MAMKPCYPEATGAYGPGGQTYLLHVGGEDVDLALVERGDIHAHDLVRVEAHGEVEVRVQVGVRALEGVAQQRGLALGLQGGTQGICHLLRKVPRISRIWGFMA